MDDLKNELERAARHYAPPPDALGRLDDKKARSGRNDKVGAMVVGLAIVGALIFAFVTIGTQKGTVQPAAGGSDDVAATPVNGDLLYSKSAEPATWHIFSYDPATGKETQLTTGSRTYGSDWSPDGTQIVYDHERPLGYEEIVIANADGSDPRTVASGQDPAWSPDGTEIAYVEDSRIWVVNTDGTNPHHVTTPGSDPDAQSYEAPYDRNPAWSPDGTAIAYTRIAAFGLVPRPSGNGQAQVSREELRVWHENGPDEVLTSDYAALGEVDWSPDGSTLVFTGGPTLFDQSGMTDGLIWPRVLTMPSGGGEVTPLTPDTQTWAAGVTWSPDGTLIAYVDDNHALVTMWPDGTHRHDLGIDPGGDAIIGPSWGVAAPSPSP
jgi:sugar lactone lactonase YvrE